MLAITMLLSLTACGDESNKSIVPFVYEQDGKTMLMDAVSGQTRQLTDCLGVDESLVMISRDNTVLYYMDKADENDETASLYTVSGNLMTAAPKRIAAGIWVYTASVDGSVAAYMQDDVLFRIVDGGEPVRVADKVQLMAFLNDSDTLQYTVEDDTDTIGDNVMYCHKDGTIEKPNWVVDVLDSTVWREWFEKEWTIEEQKLIVEGKVVDEGPMLYNGGEVSQFRDKLAYVVGIEGEGLDTKGTLKLYHEDGTVETVNEEAYALESIQSHVLFLSDGSLVYMVHEGDKQFSIHRCHNGEDTVLFDATSGVRRYNSESERRSRINPIMRIRSQQ